MSNSTTQHNLFWNDLPLEVVGRFYSGCAETREQPAEAPEFEIYTVLIGGAYDITDLLQNSWDYTKEQRHRTSKIEEVEKLIIEKFYT